MVRKFLPQKNEKLLEAKAGEKLPEAAILIIYMSHGRKKIGAHYFP